MMRRLGPDAALPDRLRPAYRPEAHGIGIAHLGPGAFHRAHQAAITDRALAAAGGDWRIVGLSLRSTAAAQALNPQGGRYTLIERGGDGVRARVIGAIARVLTAPDPAVIETLADPRIRIVTLTVTEAAYRSAADGKAAGGVPALLAAALGRRRAAGAPPPAILSCDNLPGNGARLAGLVTAAAGRTDPGLADWIAARVAFPDTMVDRITPAPDAAVRREAAALTGFADAAAVATEPFCQWVIADRFAGPRPAWEAGGAQLVADVAPWERAKLRMLNGAHSLIAYAGLHAGHALVRDAVADPALAVVMDRLMRAAAATLRPTEGLDPTAYAAALKARFANPAIAHATAQIARDGTQKLPQRLLAPAVETLAAGRDPGVYAFAVAAWMHHVARGARDDPQAEALAAIAARASTAADLADGLHALPGLFPKALAQAPAWRAALGTRLDRMLGQGMAAALAAEAARLDPPGPAPA